MAPLIGPRMKNKKFYKKRPQRKSKANKQNKNQNIVARAGGGTFSRFKLSSNANRVRFHKKVGAPNFYVTNTAGQVGCTQGFQNAGDFSVCSLPDLKFMGINSVPPGGLPVRPWRYVLESAISELLLSNSSLATAYVTIYDIVRRRDAVSGTALWSLGPSNAWAGGVSAEGTGASDEYQILQSIPTDSQYFKDYFKVIKRTNVTLAQGTTHKHHITLNPNRLLDTNLLAYLDGDMAGLTVYSMIVVYGQPASIIPGEGDPVVTTAHCEIDVVQTRRYKYTWILDNSTTFYGVDNLSTLTGEQIVSAGSGAFVTNDVK